MALNTCPSLITALPAIFSFSGGRLVSRSDEGTLILAPLPTAATVKPTRP